LRCRYCTVHRECTVGTWVGATVGRGGGGYVRRAGSPCAVLQRGGREKEAARLAASLAASRAQWGRVGTRGEDSALEFA